MKVKRVKNVGMWKVIQEMMVSMFFTYTIRAGGTTLFTLTLNPNTSVVNVMKAKKVGMWKVIYWKEKTPWYFGGFSENLNLEFSLGR
jgi:hypothetical protein